MRTIRRNLWWSIKNDKFKEFIIKKLVHEIRNATASIGHEFGSWKKHTDAVKEKFGQIKN